MRADAEVASLLTEMFQPPADDSNVIDLSRHVNALECVCLRSDTCSGDQWELSLTLASFHMLLPSSAAFKAFV